MAFGFDFDTLLVYVFLLYNLNLILTAKNYDLFIIKIFVCSFELRDFMDVDARGPLLKTAGLNQQHKTYHNTILSTHPTNCQNKVRPAPIAPGPWS
jgi:hypothetical protein